MGIIQKPKIKDISLLKNVVTIALPISLQQMLTASFHLVDTAMVVNLGNISTSAIGISVRWFFLIYLTFFGFGSGMSVIVSQFWGVKDIKTIRKSFGMGFINMVSISIIMATLASIFTPQFMKVFTDNPLVITEGIRYLKIACWAFIPMGISLSFSYLLRSTEIVILPLITTFISIVLNTILNYVLIFGKIGFTPMGIQGAAVATLISSSVQMLLMVSICYIKKNVAAARFKEMFSATREFVKKYYLLSLPVLANEVLWALGVMVYNMVFARQGVENYAAFTIYGSIEQIAFTFFVGICSACSVIVGIRVGRGDIKDAYETGKKFLISVPLFSIVIGLILIAVRNPIINLMNPETQYTAQMASKLILIYGCVLPLFILPYIAIVGIFRAGGDTKIGLKYDVINVWLIGVPIVLICGLYFKLPFEWIFVSMWSEHLVKTIICLRYFKKRRWLRVLTGTELSNS